MPREPKKLRLNNPYVIVGRCLAPSLSADSLQELVEVLKKEVMPWEILLATANMHRCTPLWYVRLRQYGLLDIVPPDLHEYLVALHAANAERNRRIKDELIQILSWFEQEEIRVILLKGAATFVDNLYDNIGARLMQDLDLLVPEADVFRAKQVLLNQDYIEDNTDQLDVEDGRIISRGNHLTQIRHPRSSTNIELHYRLLKGIGGKVLSADHFWQTAIDSKLDGHQAYLPGPTERLLHNVLHATVTSKNFIQSFLPLNEISEFAAIVNSTNKNLNFNSYSLKIKKHNLKTEVGVFVSLARTIMQIEFEYQLSIFSNLNLQRAYNCSQSISNFDKENNKITILLWSVFQKYYYYFSLPKWLWRATTLISENERKLGLCGFIATKIWDKKKWRYLTFKG